MSDAADREKLRARPLARFGWFIQGIGLRVDQAREIDDLAIANDPAAAHADIEAKARAWLLITLA